MTRRTIDALWWAGALGLVAGIIALSVLPMEDLPGPDLPWQDKWGHLLAYGLTSLWFAQVAGTGRRRLAIALGLSALGLALEIVQAMLPWRMADPADLAADILGIGIGLAVAATPAGRVLRTLEAGSRP